MFLIGLPANLLEQQQAMMMLMNSQGLMLPHMYNADRQRLLAAQSQSASMPLSAVNKEDASRTWSSHLAAAAQHSQASHKSGNFCLQLYWSVIVTASVSQNLSHQ